MLQKNRGQWSGQLGFVLAASGAAIGLGNIWKFPYMAGANGGGAFVLVYLICVLLIGLPLLAGEIMVGKRARKNPVDAIIHCAQESGKNKSWAAFGWWGIAGLFLTLSFYSVVAGWSIYYFFFTISGHFNHADATQVIESWNSFIGAPGKLILFNAIFMFMTLWVVAKGVQKGLERGSRIMMPLLFLTLIALVFYSAIAADFSKGFHFLFDFDFHKITGSVVINAMGHAFFTLALGVGAMSIYGSYMPQKISIAKAISIAVFLDVLVALLAGLAIFPLIFTYNLHTNGGPGMMFISLPMAFAQMPFGQLFGSLFFLLLFFAAWTSSINMAEPIISTLIEKTKLTRSRACWITGVVTWSLGLFSVFSFNIWSQPIHIPGLGGFTPFGLITDTVTNVILPIGGLFYAIFTGWVMKKKYTRETLSFKSTKLYIIWRFLTRYVAPIGVLVVFIAALL